MSASPRDLKRPLEADGDDSATPSSKMSKRRAYRSTNKSKTEDPSKPTSEQDLISTLQEQVAGLQVGNDELSAKVARLEADKIATAKAHKADADMRTKEIYELWCKTEYLGARNSDYVEINKELKDDFRWRRDRLSEKIATLEIELLLLKEQK